MTTLLKIGGKLRRPSKQRPKSLILSINPMIRDIMEFEHGTEIDIEVCLDENNEKIVKIRKKQD